MWQANLQDNYANFPEWEEYSDRYGLASQLGYATNTKAWEANPMIQGSGNEGQRGWQTAKPSGLKLVLDEFTTAYIKAALWASTDETNPEQGGEPLDDNYGTDDIELAALAEMVEDCRQFQTANAEWINNANVAVTSPGYGCDARAGHDFWLTRNHHGCGFWDRDWHEPAATKLDEAAKAFGEYNITASGHGGQVYAM